MRAKLIASVIVLIVAAAAVGAIPRANTVSFSYRGISIPVADRVALERSIRQSLQGPQPVRTVVTISDRVVAVRK
jgi:hypothetical protein